MFTWLSANLVNLVIVAALALIVGFAIRSMIRDRKAGKSSCGCSCASCGACGSCAGSCTSALSAPAGTKKGTRT